MSDAIKASIDTSALPDLASPTAAALAYLGDAVLELLVRERLVSRGLCASATLALLGVFLQCEAFLPRLYIASSRSVRWGKSLSTASDCADALT